MGRAFQVIFVASLLATAVVAGPGDQPTANAAGEEPSQEELQGLIEQLGDPSFARRQRATAQIERFGILAFEALHAAQYHADSEIAIAARDLLGNIQVSWDRPSDSDAVRETLTNYGTLRAEKRKERMERLAQLGERDGLAALCRLARYETDLRLRRTAALLVMLQPTSDEVARRRQVAKQIRDIIPLTARIPNEWLRLYADDLEEQRCSLEAWSAAIAAERQRLEDRTTHRTDALAVIRLARAAAMRAIDADDKQEATQFVLRTVDLLEPRRPEVLAAMQWTYRQQLWEAAIAVAEAYESTVAQYPLLQYWVAAAYQQLGQEQTAQQWADKALAANPMRPADAASAERRSDTQIRNIQRHLQIAQLLKEEGHYRWAEAEYQAVLTASPVESTAAVYAADGLARLLTYQQRYAQAVEVLEPISYRLNADTSFQKRINSDVVAHSGDYFRSRLLYNQAKAAAAEGRWEENHQYLEEALRAEPTNSDILIAMYEAEGDDTWQEYVRQQIALAADALDQRIEELEQTRPNLSDPSAIHSLTRSLASECNDYAWLVANTEGDRDKALQRSLQSVDLMPGTASFLDTLARTYWALGNKEMAIDRQQAALALEPHHLPMQRQLAFFRENEPPRR